MDETSVGYNLCEENWKKIRQVEALGEHLNEVQRWLEADSVPTGRLRDAMDNAASTTGKLLAHLIALQIDLLDNL